MRPDARNAQSIARAIRLPGMIRKPGKLGSWQEASAIQYTPHSKMSMISIGNVTAHAPDPGLSVEP
jgi:hypothetical protein